MSGVTVAQMRRSTSAASTPASSRAARGSRQRDVRQRLVLGGDAPLPDAGPLANPLVRRVDDPGELLVRHHLRGDMYPEARDPYPNPLCGADHRSTANVSVPRAASALAHVRRRLPATDRAADRVDLAGQGENVSRLDDALEAAVVDSREERDLAAVLLLDEDRDRAGLRHRLDDQHSGHHGPLGKVAAEPPVVGVHRSARDDAPARLELRHLVDEEERVAMREDRLDRLLPERGGRRLHEPSLLPGSGG